MATANERKLDWTSLDDVRCTCDQLIRASSGVCDWIKANKPRNDESLIPFNFLACSVTYLEITRNVIPAPIQVLALCTRSVYEISLLARKVLSHVDERRKWLDETASDNVSVNEAFYDLVGSSSPLAASLRRQIDELKKRITARGVAIAQRPSRIVDLAREFGLEKEHKALYGLFSKLVHPTAFLINGWQHNKDQTIGTTLLLKIIEYAENTLQSVGAYVGLPVGMTNWQGAENGRDFDRNESGTKGGRES